MHKGIHVRVALATAVVAALSNAPLALAVESATCAAPGDPHAGRQFTLSARTEPMLGDFTYRWDLDSNGSFETDTGTDGAVTTEKTAAGTYTFGVQVTDPSFSEGDPKRQATGRCDVTVVNDKPFPYFEMHPIADNFPTAYEAIRFTFSASDSEDDVNQVGEKHAIDFDGDGQFEFNAAGNGEVFTSFPAGFDKDITHRVTDAAGAFVDTKMRIKTAADPFGLGDSRVLANLSLAPLASVTAKAPKRVKRKTLLKKGVTASFSWGASWGRVLMTPSIKRTNPAFTYQPETAYAPGHKLTTKPFPPQLKKLAKPGAKLVLNWTARSYVSNVEKTGRLVVKITR